MPQYYPIVNKQMTVLYFRARIVYGKGNWCRRAWRLLGEMVPFTSLI